MDKLPLEFTHEDWKEISLDCFTLLDRDVNLTLQTITEEFHSLDNAQVYIRLSIEFQTNIVKRVLVDQSHNFVHLFKLNALD